MTLVVLARKNYSDSVITPPNMNEIKSHSDKDIERKEGVGFEDSAYGANKIEMVMCGHCEKMITPNLIASFGADHHDPDEMSCWDCFNGIIARAEMRAE